MDKDRMNQNQGLELAMVFPDIKKDILKIKPGPNPGLRQFFLDAAKTETDPEVLHNLGIRDLPRSIRYAVIDNPNTERRTIEQMARQTANELVANRAKKFLQTNPEPPIGDMMEFKMSTKNVKQIIVEELHKVLNEVYNPMVTFMDDVLQATMTANYQTIMNAMKKNAMLLHSERSELGEFKGSHRKQLLDMFAESVYRYQKSYGMEGLDKLVELAKDIKFEYQSQDDRDIDEEPPF